MTPEEALQAGQRIVEELAGTRDGVPMMYLIPRKDGCGVERLIAVEDGDDPASGKRRFAALARHVADAQGADWVCLVFEAWLGDPGSSDQDDAAFVTVECRDGLSLATIREFARGRRRRFAGAWESAKSIALDMAVFPAVVTEADVARLCAAVQEVNPCLDAQAIEADIRQRTRRAN